MKSALKVLALIILLPIIYVVAVLLYGTITDYQPEEIIQLEANKELSQKLDKDSLVLYIWNIGYAGLGEESDFFMDGGEMMRSSKSVTEKNFNGIKNTVSKWEDADFILLQEVDEVAKRSYRVNQFDGIQAVLSTDFNGVFAYNYKANFVPKPFLNPYGKVFAGLASFGKYGTNELVRYQFPGNFGWPKSIFFLDRCFLVQRVPYNNKEVVVINTHNSAYDDGSLKAGQMEYLKAFVTKEYEQGNYVIVGGDWNQCPPGYDCYNGTSAEEIGYTQSSVAVDYMPQGWKWAFDGNVRTNRKLEAPYDALKTFTTIIDFYLLSPNIEIKKVEGQDLDFKYSDHQPVKLELRLLQQ